MDEQPTKPPRNRHHPNHDYSPIFCNLCGFEFYQEVSLIIRCPLGWKALSKDGIRSKKVKIKGVFLDEARWICGCQVLTPKKHARRKAYGPRKLYRPGRRWYKNMVPPPPHKRAINPAKIKRVGKKPGA